MARSRTMIAHQGGWDEMLLVLGPIAVIIGLLSLARKRVDAAQRKALRRTTTCAASTDPARLPLLRDQCEHIEAPRFCLLI